MKEDERLYFSFCEFLLMMEFSGEDDYILFQEEPLPSKEQMLDALLKLSVRGLLEEKDGRFVPTPEGAFFRELHAAKHAFYLESVRPVRNSTVLYPTSGKETFYMVEIVPARENLQYRLSRITRKGIREWLFDSGILEEPVLSAEDAVELNSLAEEDADQSAPEDRQVILGLRDYGPGGRILAEAEIFQTGAEQYIAGPDAAPAEVFTEEALDRLLDRCFGKEEHGHS